MAGPSQEAHGAIGSALVVVCGRRPPGRPPGGTGRIFDQSFKNCILDPSFRYAGAYKCRGAGRYVARPKAFEPDEVLDRAMLVFWRKGYERTSVRDLVDYTGVNRFSLYNAFGDKRGMFLAACERYRTEVVGRRLEALERPAGGLSAIRQFFAGVVDLLAGTNGGRGCLMTNCMVEAASEDGDAVRDGRQYLTRMDTAFHAALTRARVRGEIEHGRDLHDCARYLTTTVQGLTVVGRVVRDRRVLHGIVRTALAAVG